MARRERQHNQKWEIRVTFEPHHLSPTWIAQAYEQVVPIARRSATRSRDSQQSPSSDTPEETTGRRALQGK